MAGIGKYTKGKAFKLKSGNSPAFKMMGNTEAGESPITNEFGIGKGTSPYRHKAVTGARHEHMEGGKKVLHGPNGKVVSENEWEELGAEERGLGTKGVKEKYAPDKEPKKGGGWKKAAQIGLAALTSGLDAVYGSGKIMPSGSARLIKKEKDEKEVEANTPEENIEELTGDRTGAGFSAPK